MNSTYLSLGVFFFINSLFWLIPLIIPSFTVDKFFIYQLWFNVLIFLYLVLPERDLGIILGN